MSIALLKKLKIKDDDNFLIVNGPDGYAKSLISFHANLHLSQNIINKLDVIQMFVMFNKDIVSEIVKVLPILKPETKIWISYPKKNSGIATDLGMSKSWKILDQFNLKPVAAISINNHWTALQVKPAFLVKKSASSNSELLKSNFAPYINIEERKIIIPEVLLKELNNDQINFFNSLSFTNKKEYVVWILSAKQEKTKISRTTQAIEKLNLRKRNPTEK